MRQNGTNSVMGVMLGCKHPREQTNIGPTTDQINHWCPDCQRSWTTWPDRTRAVAVPAATSADAVLSEVVKWALAGHIDETGVTVEAGKAIRAVASDAGAVGAAQAHDARRYRVLRDAAHPDTNGGLRCVGNCAEGGAPLYISGRDLDRAVDAASGVALLDGAQQ